MTSQDMARQAKARQDNIRQYTEYANIDTTSPCNIRQSNTRQQKAIQDKTRQYNTRRDMTIYDKTRLHKTRQDKTIQAKTRQDKTIQSNIIQ